jgi:hypothetical protein
MYNTEFKLTLRDIEIIEAGLRELDRPDIDITEITNLLGRLHNQKNWYRPSEIYFSG